MVQLTPDERDEARRWVGTATASIAILAVGAAGASSILAWQATTESSVTTGDGGSAATLQVPPSAGSSAAIPQAPPSAGWSAVPGNGGNLPPGGIQGAAPPGQGSGGAAVGSQGS